MGRLRYVAYGGYSWSSAPDETQGAHLNFHTTWLRPCNKGYRDYAFQLRCLSE
ncbi:hypothetical protein [uncultured Rikenella sp.]|uniref:hypothetical protein n=1 Tax=uncultured Rikenella sp. TaxID=368003 RepID=UPI0025D4DB50|nr:hypothetical protein [uncultured Rikenella sp.]